MKTKFFLLAFPLLLVHHCGGVIDPETSTKPSAQILVSDCVHDSNGATFTAMDYTGAHVHYEATGRNRLYISYYMDINCCDTLAPVVEVQNDSIIIRERYSNEDRYGCNCVCEHAVELTIENLPYSTYTLMIEGLHSRLKYNENVSFTFDFTASTNDNYYYNRDDSNQQNGVDKPDTITTSSVSQCYDEAKYQNQTEEFHGVVHIYASAGGKLNIVHDDVLLNCCTRKDISTDRQGQTLYVHERQWEENDEQGMPLECDCQCLYTFTTAFEGLEEGRYKIEFTVQPTGYTVIYITTIEIDYSEDLDIQLQFDYNKYASYWNLLRDWKLEKRVFYYNEVDGSASSEGIEQDMSAYDIIYNYDFSEGGYGQRFFTRKGDSYEWMTELDFSVVYRGQDMIIEYKALPDENGMVLPCIVRMPDTVEALSRDELVLHRQLTGCEADEGGHVIEYLRANKQ